MKNVIEIDVDTQRFADEQVLVHKHYEGLPGKLTRKKIKDGMLDDIDAICLGLIAVIRASEDSGLEKKGRLMAYAMKKLEDGFAEPLYEASIQYGNE